MAPEEETMASDLTNAQWAIVRPLIPETEVAGTGARGGRPWRDPRDVLDGILWVLRTGAPWADLPRRYPPPQTCHRRYQKWSREGVLDAVLRALALDLAARGEAPEAFPGVVAAATWPRARRRWTVQTAVLLSSPAARQALALVSAPPGAC
jgi:transposase